MKKTESLTSQPPQTEWREKDGISYYYYNGHQVGQVMYCDDVKIWEAKTISPIQALMFTQEECLDFVEKAFGEWANSPRMKKT